MSAPSILHEHRVALLQDLADLAGFFRAASLGRSLRPDVCRLRPGGPAILVADAKATESPEDDATRLRLLGYASSAAAWVSARFQVTLMVCHGLDPSRQWQEGLAAVAEIAGLEPSRFTYAVLDHTTAVTSVLIAPDVGTRAVNTACSSSARGEPSRDAKRVPPPRLGPRVPTLG